MRENPGSNMMVYQGCFIRDIKFCHNMLKSLVPSVPTVSAPGPVPSTPSVVPNDSVAPVLGVNSSELVPDKQLDTQSSKSKFIISPQINLGNSGSGKEKSSNGLDDPSKQLIEIEIEPSSTSQDKNKNETGIQCRLCLKSYKANWRLK